MTIGIFIQPGDFPLKPGEKPRKRPDGRPAPRANRSKEYDTLSDAYSRFLLEEILPEVAKRYNLTKDPEGRCIAGSSSGGICAFTVCWQRPDQFRKCFTTVGSFTNIRGGNQYPDLVLAASKKPIRIFQQDGANDIVNQFGSWPEANKAMAKAARRKRLRPPVRLRRGRPQQQPRHADLPRRDALDVARLPEVIKAGSFCQVPGAGA